jgi:hypothetical protein
MVIFKNANYEIFLLETNGKRIICYGAGGTLRDFLKLNRAHITVLNRIDYILDQDSSKSGSTVSIGLKKIPIMTIAQITALNVDFSKYIIIMCLADDYIINALQTFDEVSDFNGVACYYGLTAMTWGKEPHLQPRAGTTPLLTPIKKHGIPKIIHYCWFGGNVMGEVGKECIESWKEHCPDFEISFWNESNYDISQTPLYVRQAYEAKKYAFVSDYARLAIVYRHGGFYLDTDVLLLRNLKIFTQYRAVFGYLTWNQLATGLCFGSVAGNEDLLGQMKLYEQVLFINNGEMNLAPCPEYSTEYFRLKGMRIDNSMRLIDDTLFLPSDYLCSLMPVLEKDGLHYLSLYALTKNSYALHKCSSTWFEVDNYNVFEKSKQVRMEINNRLLADWKRSPLRNE